MIKIAIEDSKGEIEIIEIEDREDTGYMVLTFDLASQDVTTALFATDRMLEAGLKTLQNTIREHRKADLKTAFEKMPQPLKDFAASLDMDADKLMEDPLFRLIMNAKGIKL
jgi:hypothetical protein